MPINTRRRWFFSYLFFPLYLLVYFFVFFLMKLLTI